MSDYLIWWTDQAEAEAVIEMDITALPEYLQKEFRSRYGRNGRGRLWVPEHISITEIDWDENKPASRLADKRGGIVIETKDKGFVFLMPGFLTDLKLNFINE